MAKNLILWLVIAVVLMSVFQSFSPSESARTQTDYTTFLREAEQGNIREVRINNDGEITKDEAEQAHEKMREKFVITKKILKKLLARLLTQSRYRSLAIYS